MYHRHTKGEWTDIRNDSNNYFDSFRFLINKKATFEMVNKPTST